MTRRLLLPTLALPAMAAAMALSVPDTARGQALTPCIEMVTDRDSSDIDADCAGLTNVPVSDAECTANVSITVTVRGVPTSASVLDLWLAPGSEMCNVVEQRDGADDTCVNAGSVMATGSEVEFTRTLSELQIPCNESDSGVTNNVYLLASTTSPERGDVGDNYGVLTFVVDRVVPTQPSSLSGQDGENTLGVTWDAGEDDLEEHRVYVDPTGCGSSMLVSGEPVPDGISSDEQVAGNATSASIDAEGYGLALGESATVGVTAVDRAGNESVLSTTCVTRIETMGFCEAHGDCPNDCAVEAPGARGAGGAAASVLGLVALALVLRRKR